METGRRNVVTRTKEKRLSNAERKKRRKEQRARERERAARMRTLKRIGGMAALALVVVALGFGGYRLVTGAKFYPPTDLSGHSEEIPPSHILSEPMPLAIQKHMLEHADGQGPPGIVINYNCEDFPCEPDLIERMTAIAQEYPDRVYLAPFPDMDAKITLTRLGKLEVLDSFDEQRIRAFIEER